MYQEEGQDSNTSTRVVSESGSSCYWLAQSEASGRGKVDDPGPEASKMRVEYRWDIS